MKPYTYPCQPIEGEGKGTGFYLDEQDEQDGRDFWVWQETGLPRRCAPCNDKVGDAIAALRSQ